MCVRQVSSDAGTLRRGTCGHVWPAAPATAVPASALLLLLLPPSLLLVLMYIGNLMIKSLLLIRTWLENPTRCDCAEFCQIKKP